MLILLAILLLIVLPSPWNVVAFVAIAALWIAELLFWRHKVKDYKKVVGAHTLIGRTAEVVAPCRPIGQVRFDGELWSARCPTGADVGEKVRITGRTRLTLEVTTALD
jgi:membrane protein implicated in regulation of membrane protease activity